MNRCLIECLDIPMLLKLTMKLVKTQISIKRGANDLKPLCIENFRDFFKLLDCLLISFAISCIDYMNCTTCKLG
jgi:hypothetical protein